jgi:YggT family protein
LVFLVMRIVGWIFEIFSWAMLIRLVLDIFRSFKPQWQPRGLYLWLAEITYTISDWLLKPIRKVVKPLRLGSVVLDLSWTIAMILLYVVQSEVNTVIYALFSTVR